MTEITFILDRSGSMQSMTESAISGFNQFVRDQTEAEGKARLSLILFDDQYEVQYASVPIAEVTELDTTTFVPRGSTALLDAIGRTVDELGARLAAMPEPTRPDQVIVAILTDGLENASRHHTWQSVQDRIRHQTDVYQWEFLFLGANQDAIATASQIGISRQNASSWNADSIGARTSSRALSRKVKEIRFSKDNPEMHAAPPTPMSEIVREEDEKERGK